MALEPVVFECATEPNVLNRERHLGEWLSVGGAFRCQFQSVPVVNLDVVRIGSTFPGFDKRLEAQQIDGPLGTAVVHKLHRFLPALLLEEDNGVLPILF